MRFLMRIGVIVWLLTAVVSISLAAANLNSSKSNIYRIIYDAGIVSQAQAKAILNDLDKIGPADETKLKQWLPANFKRFGIQPDSVKKIIIRPVDRTRKTITVILLKNPADEVAALAVSDEGAPGKKKPTK